MAVVGPTVLSQAGAGHLRLSASKVGQACGHIHSNGETCAPSEAYLLAFRRSSSRPGDSIRTNAFKPILLICTYTGAQSGYVFLHGFVPFHYRILNQYCSTIDHNHRITRQNDDHWNNGVETECLITANRFGDSSVFVFVPAIVSMGLPEAK